VRCLLRISPKTTRKSALLRYAESSEQCADFWELLLNQHVSQLYCIIQSQMSSALTFENFPQTNSSSSVQSGLVNVLKRQLTSIFTIENHDGADFSEFELRQSDVVTIEFLKRQLHSHFVKVTVVASWLLRNSEGSWRILTRAMWTYSQKTARSYICCTIWLWSWLLRIS